MSIAAVIAATNAAYLIGKQDEERQNQEKQKRKRDVSNQLLLLGKEYSMEIGNNEKVIVIELYYNPNYKNIYNNNAWISSIDDEIILVKNTFSSCLKETINKFNVKGYSLIPYSVSKQAIDIYWLMLKVPDEDKIKKDESFDKMAKTLTEDIQTAW